MKASVAATNANRLERIQPSTKTFVMQPPRKAPGQVVREALKLRIRGADGKVIRR
jgi:hypothetical protein